MFKSELAKEIAEKAGISSKKAIDLIDAFTEIVTGQLQSGSDVTITGFGSFHVAERGSRVCRNPQTGKEMKVEAKKIVKFKPGAALRDALK